MLTHYIIVRKDLPLGVCAAMITHAAGESAVFYQDPDGRFRNARAVVLEAKNEWELDKAAVRLWKHDIQCVEIWEHDGPYAQQLMAIGVVPVESDSVEKVMRPFQTLKELDKETESA